MSTAIAAAERGHHVTVYESASRVGGQLTLAAEVPGKEDFQETLRYFETRAKRLGISVGLGETPEAQNLASARRCGGRNGSCSAGSRDRRA